MKKLRLLLVMAVGFMFIGLGSASWITDIASNIIPAKRLNDTTKNIVMGTVMMAPMGIYPRGVTACFNCSGYNIVENLVDGSGLQYLTDESDPIYMSNSGDIVQYEEGEAGYVPSNGGTFADSDRWATDPSDSEIIEKYFGTNSAYTDLWSGTLNTCVVGSMSVVDIASGSALSSLTIANNTIYVLGEGIHTTNSKTFTNNCVAFVSLGDAIIVPGGTNSSVFGPKWTSSNMIFDNFSVDGLSGGEFGSVIKNNVALGGIDNITVSNLYATGIAYLYQASSLSVPKITRYSSIIGNTVNISDTLASAPRGLFLSKSDNNYAYNNTFTFTTGSNNAGISVYALLGEETYIKYNTFIGLSLGIELVTGSITLADTNIFCNNTSDGYTGTNALACGDVFPGDVTTYTNNTDSIQFSYLVDANEKPYLTGYASNIPQITNTTVTCTDALAGIIKFSGDFYGCKSTASGRVQLKS